MSRYIEADVLTADLDKGLWGKDYDKALAEAIINDAPSIDIVRCGECKLGQTDIFHMFCAYHHHKTYADDFCSYGEKR